VKQLLEADRAITTQQIFSYYLPAMSQTVDHIEKIFFSATSNGTQISINEQMRKRLLVIYFEQACQFPH
jgi:hypothetical protein